LEPERPVRARKSISKVRRPAPVDDDLDDLDDEEDEPVRPVRKAASKPVTRRRPPPVNDEDDEEDDEPPARRKRTASPVVAKRRQLPVADDEDDDEDEEPVRRPKRSSKSSGRRSQAAGVRTGWAGADETAKSGVSSIPTLTLSKDPQLLVFLEDEPFVSYRQHWIDDGQSPGKGDRPYTCVGIDCPLCGIGDRPSASFMFNVLVLSAPDYPDQKVLRVAVTAYTALKEAAISKTSGKPKLLGAYFTVSRSGTGTKSQTNFRTVKPRDLEEDWPEIFDNFEADDLPDMIEEAKGSCFGPEVVDVTPVHTLKELAKYLASEEDD
jgi:hypothetical protein